MLDIYKGCDPKDDDTWSFGSLMCWLFLVAVVFFGACAAVDAFF